MAERSARIWHCYNLMSLALHLVCLLYIIYEYSQHPLILLLYVPQLLHFGFGRPINSLAKQYNK